MTINSIYNSHIQQNILYLMQSGNSTFICLNDGAIIESELAIKKLLNELNMDAMFRLDRSIAINLTKIDKIKTGFVHKVIMENGVEIEIPLFRRRQFNAKIENLYTIKPHEIYN